MTVLVYPATADRWNDLADVMGTRGDPSRCWCQFFRFHRSDLRDASVADLCGMLHDQVASATPPGVLAYRDGVAAGWCAVGPKPDYARLRSSPISSQVPYEDGVWSVTCFVVRVGHRRHGVAAALLDGAVALASAHGATAVEAYPVDPSARPNVTSAELYHGPLSTSWPPASPKPTARPIVRRSCR